MSQPQRPRHYRLDLKETSASNGYFAAGPQDQLTLEAGLAYLCRHPNDSFMHAYLLECIGEMDLRSVLSLLNSEKGSSRPGGSGASAGSRDG